MNRFTSRCLFLLTLVGAGPAAGQAAPGTPDLRKLSHTLETVAAKVGHTVVQIRVAADRFRDMVSPDENLISRLGILALEVTPELASVIPGLRVPHGVVVAGVALASEGMAGPLPGDVIHEVNGTSVRTIADLRTAIGELAPDSVAVLQVGREGRLRFITVTLE